MGIKEQFIKIKENWLIIALVLFLLFAFSSGNLILGTISSGIYEASFGTEKIAAVADSGFYQERAYYPIPSEDFAPEVKDRKVTKTTSLSTEVKRGAFKDSEAKLKTIISSSSSYLLHENVNKYDTERRSYYVGRY